MSKVLKITEVINYSPKADEKMTISASCPRCMNDVYSLGISLQYFIGNIYLKLADTNQGNIKKHYEKLALKQLHGKEKIEKLAKIHTNELLAYFYNNGGPIIEPPLSEQEAKEKQPFFSRIMNSFFVKLESSLDLNASSIISPDELENAINISITELYTNLGKLIQVDEIVQAFDELISIRNGNKA